MSAELIEPGIFRIEAYERSAAGMTRLSARLVRATAALGIDLVHLSLEATSAEVNGFRPLVERTSPDGNAHLAVFAMHDVLVLELALNAADGVQVSKATLDELRQRVAAPGAEPFAACDVWVAIGTPIGLERATELGGSPCFDAALSFANLYVFDARTALLIASPEQEHQVNAYLTNTLPVALVVAARLAAQVAEIEGYSAQQRRLMDAKQGLEEARASAYRQLNALLRMLPEPAVPGADGRIRNALTALRSRLVVATEAARDAPKPQISPPAELLPFPLAFSYHLLDRVYPNRVRFLRVIDLINVLIGYVAALAIVAAREHPTSACAAELLWSDLARMSTGGFKDLISATATALLGSKVRPFLPELSSLVPASEAVRELEWLTHFRNRQYGHAAAHEVDRVYQDLVDEARPHLDHLVGELAFLTHYELVWVESRNQARDGTVLVRERILMGPSRYFPTVERTLAAAEARFEFGDVCIRGADGRLRSLYPFLRVEPCKACGEEPDLFLISRATDGGLEYLSYQDGQPLERSLLSSDRALLTGSG